METFSLNLGIVHFKNALSVCFKIILKVLSLPDCSDLSPKAAFQAPHSSARCSKKGKVESFQHLKGISV